MFGLQTSWDKKTAEVAGFPGRYMACSIGKIFCCAETCVSDYGGSGTGGFAPILPQKCLTGLLFSCFNLKTNATSNLARTGVLQDFN